MNLADLQWKSMRGGVVTLISQAIAIAVQLASVVVLARLLSPKDYGTIAMVTVITSFAGIFRDLGLSSSAIQKKNLTRDQQSNLFWLNVIMGALLTIICASVSPLVVWFYGKPELHLVTIALSFSFLIGSFGAQHGAMLTRKMQFGRKAVATICGALMTLGVSIALALQGHAYWSLVWGNLSGGLVTTVLLYFLSPFRPGMISRGSGVSSMLKFGVNISAFNLVNYLHRNLDNLLIGKSLGVEALGVYSRAYSLLMLPITAIRRPINAVGFPALSRLQDSPEDFRVLSRQIISVIALLSMPLVTYLGVCANWIVPLALGSGWEESIVVFAVLSVAAFFQPVSSIRGQVMLSMGRSDRYLRWGVANGVAVAIAFVVGIQWGVLGVAIAYSIVNTLILIPSIYYAFEGTPMRPKDFFGPVAFPALASLVAAALVVGGRSFLPVNPSLVLLDAARDSLLFGTTYCSLILSGRGWIEVLRGFRFPFGRA